MQRRHAVLRRNILLALTVLALVAASGVWLVSGGKRTPGVDRTTIEAASIDTTINTHHANTGFATNATMAATMAKAPPPYQTPATLGDTPFAASLAGTDIDGQLQADANGNLVIDVRTRDFFDYFLNTIGEVPPERALGELEALARASLPEQAAEEAMTLLDQYLDYKEQALALTTSRLDPNRQYDPGYQLTMLQGALSDLKQLRRASFSPEAHAAFFGLEEAYGDYTLATLEIQQRDDLSAGAKKTLQDWHRQQLPELIRKTETRLLAESEANARRQAALAEATSPEDAGRRLRELGLDAEQTGEVVAYLQEREDFRQGFEQYRQEVSQLDPASLAPDDMEALKAELLDRHFQNEKTRTWARLKSIDTHSP